MKQDIKNLKRLPISEYQKRFFLEWALAPLETIYNISRVTKISGKLDEKILKRACETFIDRNDIVYSQFSENGESCYYGDFSFNDFYYESVLNSNQSIQSQIEDFLYVPFDLTKGPLFRLNLIKSKEENNQEFYFFFVAHHIICDLDWMLKFFNQIEHAYNNFAKGKEIFTESQKTLSQAVEAEKKIINIDFKGKAQEFWLDFIREIPLNVRLPYCSGVSAVNLDNQLAVKAGGFIYFELNNPQSLQLRGYAKQKGTTLFIVLSALYGLVLSKYINQETFFVSYPVNTRPNGFEEVVGCFVNNVPMKFELSGVNTMGELVGLLAAQRKMVKHFQRYSLINIIDDQRKFNHSETNNVFNIGFSQSYLNAVPIKLHDLRSLPVDITSRRSSIYEIGLLYDDRSSEIKFRLEYRKILFDPNLISEFINSFRNAIHDLIENKEILIRDYSVLPPAIYDRVIYDWNKSDKDYPKDKTIHELFAAQAKKTPASIALVYEGEELSYRELEARSNQVSRHIRARYKARTKAELQPDTLIALCLERSLEMVIGILGVLKAGGAYVPIDPGYPQDRIDYMMEDTGAELVLSQRDLDVRLPEEKKVYIGLSEELYEEEDRSGLPLDSKATNLAYVIYTSGTTGKPKGVMVEHHQVLSFAVSNNFIDYEEVSVVGGVSNYAFDGSIFDIFFTLLNGKKLILINKDQLLDLSLLEDCFITNKVDTAFVTTALFNSLVIHQSRCLGILKQLLFGGEACNKELIKDFKDHYKKTSLIHVYGPTENIVYSSYCNLSNYSIEHGVPIGTRLSDKKLYVLDTNHNPVPVGVSGELYIGGAGVARGYLNRAELTAERFISNPFATTEDKSKGYTRLYKTGDLVRWLGDGNLEYLGRNDDQVKIRGYRIELGEVEHALSQVAGIRQSCVVVKERETETGLMKYLAGYYVAEIPLSKETIIQELSESLPEYMIPGTLTSMESFPLTVNGKLDKRSLPDAELGTSGEECVERKTALELTICGIWEELLGLERVGIHDDFFRIGGDSILAIHLSHRLSKALGNDIRVADIFKHKTIAQLLEDSIGHAEITIPATSVKSSVLSFAQERLWFIEEYEQGTNAYHMPGVYELPAGTEKEGISYAIRSIVVRHEVLRSTIAQGEDQQGMQVVHEEPVQIKEVLIHEHEDYEALLREDINRPFDLSREYPIRVVFYHLAGSGRTLLLINTHHIASDGWSTEIFQRELRSYYEAYMRKEESFSLPALAIQYKDYALWQRSYLTGDVLNEQLSYWKAKLMGYQTLNLPTDHTRPSQIDYRGGQEVFTLSSETSGKLRALGKRYGGSMHSVLLSGLNILLGKYTGQDDIVTGSPTANRQYRQTEGLIGFFVNTQVNRTLLRKEQSYEELIREVHQEQASAQLHQDLPFEKLVDELEVERDLGRHAIFQVMFAVQSFGREHKTGTDQTLSAGQPYLESYSGSISYAIEKFDLSLFMDDSGEEIRGRWSYATSLFDRERIVRLMGYYTHLLEQLSSAPDQPYSRVSLLNAENHQKLIYDWNNTDKDYPKDKTLHELFAAQAKQTPERIALVFEGQELSYQELDEKSNQLARHIRARYKARTQSELQPDTLIALCLERSLEMVIGILGVLKAGGAYVPIDAGYPQDRIDYLLADTEAELVLSQRSLQEKGEITLPGEKTVYIDLSEELYQAEEVSSLPEYSGPGDLAYVIYTSGTTGKPKGVMVEHRSVNNLVFVEQHQLEIDSESKILQFASLVFDASVWELFSALLSGAQLIIVPNYVRQDGLLLGNYIKRHGINIATLPPALLNAMGYEGYSDLRTLVVAGESSSAELLRSWSPGRRLINAYGPTEVTVCGSMHVYEQGDLNTNIGKGISNTKVYVLDVYGNPVPVGVAGELYIGGAGVSRGYLNRAELTAERFISNPFATTGDKSKGYTRIYKTGDLVRWLSDGNLEYLGRNDDQVKIRGYRIELGEVEHALSQVAGIRQSCVVIKERETESGTIKYLAGYYVVEIPLSKEAIIAQLTGVLPEYMIPGTLTSMESFPLTVNGKLDKQALPDAELGSTGEDYVEPKTALELTVCGIWAELLGLERVSMRDDFFRIGGNSILAIQLSHRLSKALGNDIRVADLFRHKTIAQLLEHSLGHAEITIPATSVKSSVLSFAQERLWFIEEYEQGTNAYHMPGVYELPAGTEKEGISYAIRSVVRRHEVLRSTIVQGEDQQGMQVVHEEPVQIKEVLIHEHEDYEALLREDINRPFDLSREYPIRVIFYHLAGSGRTLLLINTHHIASDGWSTEIFQRELRSYYEAYMRKEESFSLPALAIQYKDYALWQRSYLTGDVLNEQLSYWKAKLMGYQTLNLPTDHTRPSQIDYRGGQEVFTLSSETSGKLRAIGKRYGVTMHSVLLSGLNILLGKYTGQDDIVTGSPTANRQYRQTEGLIGFFVNTQVNRTLLRKEQSYEELIREVHQEQASAQLHQDLPFEKLVDELGLERDLSRHPVFQVSFVVQSFGNKHKDKGRQESNLEPLHLSGAYAIEKFDLSLFMDDSGEEIRGQMSYAMSLFRKETIIRLMGYYTHLLERLTANPEQSYSSLSLLTASDYQELVYERNATDKSYPQDKTLHELFAAQAERTPARIALVFEGQELSYQELDEKSNQLARYIRARYKARTKAELQPDTLIALCLERSLEMVIGILGVLKAGGAYVPIDTGYPQDRIDYLLADTGAELVLSQRSLDVQLPEEKKVYIDLSEELYQAEEVSSLPEYSGPGNLAYVIYTSGTTGKPKGVMVEHKSVINLAHSQSDFFDIKDGDTAIQFASYVFDASVSEIFTAFTKGAQLMIAPDYVKQDGSELGDYIRRHGINIATLPPALLHTMGYEGYSDLRTLVVAGESSSAELLRNWRIGRRLINAYGPTEVTVCGSMHVYEQGDLNTNIGKGIANTQVYVLDTNHNPVPIGVAGELYIGGAGVARGYLNRAELTAERFISNPFATATDIKKGYTRIYKTGDLVRWLGDGNLEYMGRNDDQVKIRGYRIELGEVEHALSQVAGIRQSCVVVKERETESGTIKYLAGYYVAEEERTLSKEAILKDLSEVLPEYMIPGTLTSMESFPLTVNGKLDKQALPDAELGTTGEGYVAPSTALELTVCKIWEELLGVERISITDDFFRIGGNSILAIQLSHRLSKALGSEISVADIFKLKSINFLLENIVLVKFCDENIEKEF